MDTQIFSATIQGHLLFHHGMENNTCQRGLASSNVDIILGPALLMAWDIAGKLTPIMSASNSNFLGWMIGVTICFTNQSKQFDRYHKRGRVNIKIFLS